MSVFFSSTGSIKEYIEKDSISFGFTTDSTELDAGAKIDMQTHSIENISLLEIESTAATTEDLFTAISGASHTGNFIVLNDGTNDAFVVNDTGGIEITRTNDVASWASTVVVEASSSPYFTNFKIGAMPGATGGFEALDLTNFSGTNAFYITDAGGRSESKWSAIIHLAGNGRNGYGIYSESRDSDLYSFDSKYTLNVLPSANSLAVINADISVRNIPTQFALITDSYYSHPTDTYKYLFDITTARTKVFDIKSNPDMEDENQNLDGFRMIQTDNLSALTSRSITGSVMKLGYSVSNLGTTNTISKPLLELTTANSSGAAINITQAGTGTILTGDHTGASGDLINLSDGGTPVFVVSNDGSLDCTGYSAGGTAGVSGWVDDGTNFRVTVTNGIITAIDDSTAGGHS